MKEEVEQFFDDYAAGFNSTLAGQIADVSDVRARFADFFVESSPLGVIGKRNDESFAEKIPQGYEFYKNAGITSMDIVSKEIRIIDDFHAMATIHWSSAFQKKTGEAGTIEFDVTYFLNAKEGLKIFAYITGDEEGALKEHGLL